MPLDDTQKARAKEYLDSRFKCVNCGQAAGYEVDLGYIPLEQPTPGGVVRAIRSLPVLVVGCDNCRFVQFYSGRVVGVAT